jgi:hypothetical protein
MIFSDLSNVKNLRELTNTINSLITQGDDDGFGYAIKGRDGTFGERTVSPETFRAAQSFNKSNMVESFPFASRFSNKFGKWSSAFGPGLFHGRTSTNDATLRNTHPISKNGWHLIHNGVVGNTGPDYKMTTTNDTEHLVHYLSTSGIKGIEKNLSGYFAIGAIDPDGKLHIAKCATAPLYMSYVTKLETFVFGTTADLIQEVADEMEWDIEPIAKMQDNFYIVMNGNEVTHKQKIETIGMVSNYERDMMSTSMHHLEGTSSIVNIKDHIKTSKSNYSPSSIYDINVLDEIEEYAKYYTIYDKNDQEIDYNEFSKLDTNDKLNCIIVDPLSGEPLDPYKMSGNWR